MIFSTVKYNVYWIDLSWIMIQMAMTKRIEIEVALKRFNRIPFSGQKDEKCKWIWVIIWQYTFICVCTSMDMFAKFWRNSCMRLSVTYFNYFGTYITTSSWNNL